MKRISILSVVVLLLFAVQFAFADNGDEEPLPPNYSFNDGIICYVLAGSGLPTQAVTRSIPASLHTSHSLSGTIQAATNYFDTNLGARATYHLVSNQTLRPDVVWEFYGLNQDTPTYEEWTCGDIQSGSYYSVIPFLRSGDSVPIYGGYAEATCHINNN